MKDFSKSLADQHNFGRVVRRKSKLFLSKPRPLFWEWLFLGKTSGFRSFLDSLGNEQAPFVTKYFPLLNFRGDVASAGGADVEFLELSRLKKKMINRPDIFRFMGSFASFALYFGLEDLHCENVFFGEDSRGDFVMGPIDLEFIFQPSEVPSDTCLLIFAGLQNDGSGFRDICKLLGSGPTFQELLILCDGYLSTLLKLRSAEPSICQFFADLGEARVAPIRFQLRRTTLYRTYLDGTKKGWSKILPPLGPELEQLTRGDVPYFYRFLGSKRIRYFADEALEKSKIVNSGTCSLSGIPNLVDPRRRISRTPRFARILNEGLANLVYGFAPKRLTGKGRLGDLSMRLSEKRLECEFPPMNVKFDSPRDWSAFTRRLKFSE